LAPDPGGPRTRLIWKSRRERRRTDPTARRRRRRRQRRPGVTSRRQTGSGGSERADIITQVTSAAQDVGGRRVDA